MTDDTKLMELEELQRRVGKDKSSTFWTFYQICFTGLLMVTTITGYVEKGGALDLWDLMHLSVMTAFMLCLIFFGWRERMLFLNGLLMDIFVAINIEKKKTGRRT